MSNIVYKCPGCPCIFSCRSDLEKHFGVFSNRKDHVEAFKQMHKRIEHDGDGEVQQSVLWRKSQTSSDEYCLAVNDLFHKKIAEQNNGWSSSGMYEYKLSGNGKWLLRRPVHG